MKDLWTQTAELMAEQTGYLEKNPLQIWTVRLEMPGMETIQNMLGM
ncbi:putative uncharacterized protein [Blautia hydrogenotrophica CAG:147]|nr:hypothetical protein [Blautia hydrogenotrophica]CCX58976.1 putative uncharacterized protein [Blautia hydrogenotrophica CAG:147]